MAAAEPEPNAGTVNAPSTKVHASRHAATPSLAVVASVAGATAVAAIWWRRCTGRKRRG